MTRSEAEKIAQKMSLHKAMTVVVRDKFGQFDVVIWDKNLITGDEVARYLNRLHVVNNYENGVALFA